MQSAEASCKMLFLLRLAPAFHRNSSRRKNGAARFFFVTLAFAAVFPVFAAPWIFWFICSSAAEFREKERRRPQVTDDYPGRCVQ